VADERNLAPINTHAKDLYFNRTAGVSEPFVITPTTGRVLTLPGLAALLLLRLIIQTALLGSYMRKTVRSPGKFNIGPR